MTPDPDAAATTVAGALSSRRSADPSADSPWQAQALWQQLAPHLPGLSVEVLARVESTNTVLLERARLGRARHNAPVTTPGELEAIRSRGGDTGAAGGPVGRRAGDAHPALLVAEHQTLGRGRQGRTWASSPGQSLTFSLALPLRPRDWHGLSLAVGVTIADALEPPEPGRASRLQLKWPNDLWLADPGQPPGAPASAPAPQAAPVGRKLGGVLIETIAVGTQRMVVVGVGLNIGTLTSQPGAPLREFGSGFACLQELDSAASAPSALHRIALPLVRALQQFEREGFAGFAAAYSRRDLLRGRRVATHEAADGQAELHGVAEGVSRSGSLLLRVGSALHLVSSGEISVRLEGDALRPAPGDERARLH